MRVETSLPVKSASIQAIVIHKDGTREDLGTVAYYHHNPLMRLLWACKKKIKGGYKWLRY